MAVGTLSLSFEDRITNHFQEFGEKRLNSQAWPRSPFYEIMSRNAKPYKGGEYMSETVEINYTANGDAIDEGSTIAAPQVQISTQAVYQPRMVQETFYIDGIRREKIMTGGDMGPVLNWVDEVAANRARAIRENVATFITAASTGTAADGSTRLTTIFDIVKETGDLGGIPVASNAWWAGTLDTTGAAWSAGGVQRVRAVLRRARKYQGFEGPDVFFASATTIDALKAGGYTKTNFERAPSKPEGYDVGDGAYRWSAHMPFDPDAEFDTIPVYYDSHLDAIESSAISTGGVLLGVNTKAVFFRKRPGPEIRTDPAKYSEQKHGTYVRMFWGLGNLVCVNRNSNVLVTSIT